MTSNNYSDSHHSYSINECCDIIKNIINKNYKNKLNQTDDSLAIVMAKMLEYVLTHEGTEETAEILALLIEFISKLRELKKEERVEIETKDKQLLKAEKEKLMRFVIYEIYKMINPHKIAGETAIENFVHNIVIRGVEAAIFYDRHADIKKKFSMDEKHRLAKIGGGYGEFIRQSGNKGFGMGF